MLGFRGALQLVTLTACTAAIAAASTVGAACVQDTLSNYIKNTSNGPGTGCTVAGLQYTNFFFLTTTTNIDHSGTPAGSIVVTPNDATGLTFTGFAPNTFVGTTIDYFIGFDVLTDPAPILTGDSISLDPPVGNVVLTLSVCLSDTPFFTGQSGNLSDNNLYCGTQPTFAAGSNVAIQGPNFSLANKNGTDQTGEFDFLSGVPQFGMLLHLTLTDDTTASVGAIGNNPIQQSGVPEPASCMLLGGGFIALWALRKRRS